MENNQKKENKWNINIEEERKYWKNYILKYFVYLPEACPQWNKTKFSIGNINNLMNPIRFECNNYKCLYRCNLRKFSFLYIFPNIPGTVIFKIIQKFILKQKNGVEIKNYLKTNENIYISRNTISKYWIGWGLQWPII